MANRKYRSYATELKKGDIVICEAGDVIPSMEK